MRQTITILFLASLSFSSCAQPALFHNIAAYGADEDVAVARLLDSAQTCMDSGDTENAIAAYQQAADARPADPKIQERLIAGWNALLRKEPTKPETHIGLGQAFRQHGDFGQAKAEYEQALRFSPGHRNPVAERLLAALPAAQQAAEVTRHINNGVDFQSRQLYDPAIQEYQQALKLDPGNSSIWVKLGNAFEANKNQPAALRAYQQALRLNPGNMEAIRSVAMARGANQLAQAKSMPLDKVLEVLPDAQRFEAEKASRKSLAAAAYLAPVQPDLEKSWHPPSHTGLLITKLKITIDRSGKLEQHEMLTKSGSAVEDQSVIDLLNSFSFPALPTGAGPLELYLSFMADDRMKMVDIGTAPHN